MGGHAVHANPAAQPVEIVRIGCHRRRRGSAFEQQDAQALAVAVLADQLPDVLARAAVAALTDLVVHEGLEGLGQRNVHDGHGATATALARIGKRACQASGGLEAGGEVRRDRGALLGAVRTGVV